jgi:hypothetical protein
MNMVLEDDECLAWRVAMLGLGLFWFILGWVFML